MLKKIILPTLLLSLSQATHADTEYKEIKQSHEELLNPYDGKTVTWTGEVTRVINNSTLEMDFDNDGDADMQVRIENARDYSGKKITVTGDITTLYTPPPLRLDDAYIAKPKKTGSTYVNPKQVAKDVLGTYPKKITHNSSTKFLMLELESNDISIRSHLYQIKSALPQLLEKLPDVDTFSFRYQQKGTDYLKYQVKRANIENINFSGMMVADLEGVADIYWILPQLR